MRFVRSLQRMFIQSGMAIAFGALITGSAIANDWYVDVNAPSGGDGSQARPFQTIHDAFHRSNNGDRVLVATGTYKETLLTVTASISILGQQGAATTIDDGQGPALIIANGRNVWLQDLTFAGSSLNYNGGGIVNSGTTVAVRCHVTGCSAVGGGGIYNTGTLVMWGCEVDGCTATGGPGGGIWNTATLKLFDCSVHDNVAYPPPVRGGGGTAVAGGIFSSSYPVTPDVSVVRLVNVTVANNLAEGNMWMSPNFAVGGGIIGYGKVSIDHSTIANNRAEAGPFCSADGGGVWSTEADVTHSIIADNVADSGADFSGICDSRGYLLIRDTNETTIQGDMTGVQTGVDPLLLPLADNGGLVETIALDPTSPCIDTGNPDPLASPADDARGFPRALWDPAVGPSDLGAFEYGATISFLLTATPAIPLAANAVVALTTGGGIGSQLFVLTLVDVNGAPLFVPVQVANFDQSGISILETTVPPGLSGLTAGFRNFSLDARGRLEQTNVALLTFQ